MCLTGFSGQYSWIIMGKGKEGKQETDYVRIHNLCRTLFSHLQSEEFGENGFHNLFEFEKSLTSMINAKFHEYIRKNKRINQGKHKMISGVSGRENNKNSVVTVILNNCHQDSDLTIKQKCSRKCNVFVISNLNESALLYFFPWNCYMWYYILFTKDQVDSSSLYILKCKSFWFNYLFIFITQSPR